ncbi:flagellar brake protein [Psychromonas sp.]|nr:flagellar brake protein [Psychromonas sp.]
MAEIDNKKFNYLNKVHCAEVVHLQIITATKPIRLKTRLIGVDPNMSVILAFGSDASWEKALPLIKEGNPVVARIFSNEQQQANIIAFRTTIQKIMTITGRWLVLSYPKSIESVELRQHLRISVHIEANVLDEAINTTLASGILSDISIRGCAFISDNKTQLTLNSVYRLSIKIDDEVMELAVELKNIQNGANEGQFQYGLVFTAPEEEREENIQQLLLHHLQK